MLSAAYHSDGVNMANTQRSMQIAVKACIHLSCLEGWKVHIRQTIFFFFSLFLSLPFFLSPSPLLSFPPFYLPLSLLL